MLPRKQPGASCRVGTGGPELEDQALGQGSAGQLGPEPQPLRRMDVAHAQNGGRVCSRCPRPNSHGWGRAVLALGPCLSPQPSVPVLAVARLSEDQGAA